MDSKKIARTSGYSLQSEKKKNIQKTNAKTFNAIKRSTGQIKLISLEIKPNELELFDKIGFNLNLVSDKTKKTSRPKTLSFLIKFLSEIQKEHPAAYQEAIKKIQEINENDILV